MAALDKSQIIRSLFAAYQAKRPELVEQRLSADFTFTSPYDDAIDKATYFERCWPNSVRIREHVIERIFVKGNEAFVTYKCLTRDGKEFRNTEFFVFEGDMIKQITVYFGATYRNGTFVRQE